MILIGGEFPFLEDMIINSKVCPDLLWDLQMHCSHFTKEGDSGTLTLQGWPFHGEGSRFTSVPDCNSDGLVRAD